MKKSRMLKGTVRSGLARRWKRIKQTYGIHFVAFVVATILVIAMLIFGACAGFYKVIEPTGHAEAIDRITGKRCELSYSGVSESEMIEGYGSPCDVEVRRKMKEIQE